MKFNSLIALAGASGVVMFTQVASAHPGHGAATGFASGVLHPLSGVDHLLAMFAVGLCAAQLGGRALWMLPGAFLAFMVGGGILGMSGAPVPMIEQGIAASVLLLGLIIAANSTLAAPVIGAMVALFAMFHGYAHGAEMHPGVMPLAYAAGFVLATALLLLAGIGSGVALRRAGHPRISRIAGAAIAICGIMLFVA